MIEVLSKSVDQIGIRDVESLIASRVPEGEQIDCDTDEDNFPIVGFIAETDGVYRAVLTAASVDGGGTSFAGMVVFRVSDEDLRNNGTPVATDADVGSGSNARVEFREVYVGNSRRQRDSDRSEDVRIHANRRTR